MTNFPYPGTPVRGSKTGKPLMALFDLLGRTWSMGVLWQLCQGGACTFRVLQTRCESISPAVLNGRLKELREALLVEKTADGYGPTDLGLQLVSHLLPFGQFAKQWATELGDHAPVNEQASINEKKGT